MNIVSVSALAVVTAVTALTLRPKNSEIALLMTAACAAMILISVLGSAASVIETVKSIVAASNISTGYIAILLKVIGICLITEFAADTCRDAGSSALASHITLAGKLFVTLTSLPLYADILNMVSSLLGGTG